MYKNTPKPKNTYAKIVSLVSLLLGSALFVMSNSGMIAAPAIAQLLGLFLMTAAIYIASVFLLRQYTFEVDENPSGEERELDFTITERKGNRDITVCRIGLDEIIMAREVNAQNKNQVSAERKKMKRYAYDTTFIAAKKNRDSM
ncbi:MAG: hypothetical protein E7677_01450 [Ruminococcaceae bacterium]|nr:hypothetical protein [Oscillospiraceae bacterium]